MLVIELSYTNFVRLHSAAEAERYEGRDEEEAKNSNDSKYRGHEVSITNLQKIGNNTGVGEMKSR